MKNRVEILTEDSLFYFETTHSYSYEKLLDIVENYQYLIFEDLEIDCNCITDISINEYAFLSKRYIHIETLKTYTNAFRYKDFCYE